MLRTRPSPRLGPTLLLSILLGGCATPAAPLEPAPGSTPGMSPASGAPPTVEPIPTIPPAAMSSAAIRGGPNVIAVSAGRVWVELHRTNRLTSVEPDGLTEVPVGPVTLHCGIAASGDHHIWGTSHPSSLVTRVDAMTGQPDLTVEIDDVCGIGASDDQVWVTTPGSGRVLRLDPETGRTVLDVDVPDGPFGAAPIGDVVYASGEGGGGWIAVLDPETGQTLALKEAPGVVMPDALAVADGSLWAIGRLDRRLFRLDPRTLETQATVEIGVEPSGLAVVDDAIWAAQLRGVLTRVDTATNAVTDRWALPYTWLSWPTYGFDRLWLTSLEEDAVIAVDLDALTP